MTFVLSSSLRLAKFSLYANIEGYFRWRTLDLVASKPFKPLSFVPFLMLSIAMTRVILFVNTPPSLRTCPRGAPTCCNPSQHPQCLPIVLSMEHKSHLDILSAMQPTMTLKLWSSWSPAWAVEEGNKTEVASEDSRVFEKWGEGLCFHILGHFPFNRYEFEYEYPINGYYNGFDINKIHVFFNMNWPKQQSIIIWYIKPLNLVRYHMIIKWCSINLMSFDWWKH